MKLKLAGHKPIILRDSRMSTVSDESQPDDFEILLKMYGSLFHK